MTQYYRIHVKGHLDKSWADWMGGLTIIHQANGDTLLVGSLPDQGALHGVLNEYTKLFAQIEDDYIRERMADIRDVIGRVIGACG